MTASNVCLDGSSETNWNASPCFFNGAIFTPRQPPSPIISSLSRWMQLSGKKKPVVALLVLITSRPAILSLAAVQTKCDESFRVAAVAEVGVQSNYQRPGKHPGRRRSIPRRGRRSQGCHYDLLRLIGTLLPPLDPLSSLPASSSSSSSSMRRHTHNNKKKDKLGQQQQHQLATLCSFCVVLHPQP